MLLYVSGTTQADEALARAFYNDTAAAWGPLAKGISHPRTGLALEPVVTRFDLFLSAFSPAPAAGPSGLRIAIPPPEHAFMWGIPLRRAVRELITNAVPTSPRWMAPFDAGGPVTLAPNPAALPPMADVVARLREGTDPGQLPSDPRLWLVLAPPMSPEVELMFLPAFLRAEPFARVIRAPATPEPDWLAREVAELVAGKNLARHGLVLSTNPGEPRIGVTYKDAQGNLLADVTMLEATSGLEETYAWKCVVQPGQCSARLHSHTGSEELYVILSGEGVLRVNERVLPVKAGDCFGKPRNYDTATQLVNTGTEPLVYLDFGTMNRGDADLVRYPEHGELLARFGGHRWLLPTDVMRPGAEFWALYDRRYYRTSKGPGEPDK